MRQFDDESWRGHRYESTINQDMVLAAATSPNRPVEATLVAGGIKIALLTTAFGLMIAIPVSIGHNYFVSRIDSLVIDMEESAQKMVDTLHAIEAGRAG